MDKSIANMDLKHIEMIARLGAMNHMYGFYFVQLNDTLLVYLTPDTITAMLDSFIKSASYNNIKYVKVAGTCSKIIRLNFTSAEIIDVSLLDTSNVTSMSNMFSNCINIKSFNLSNFNTAQVITMRNMFFNCRSLTDVNLSSFNTSSLQDCSDMFNYCASLPSLDLSSFYAHKLHFTDSMFAHCDNLERINLGNFKYNSIRVVSGMFNGCTKLKYINEENANALIRYELELLRKEQC